MMDELKMNMISRFYCHLAFTVAAVFLSSASVALAQNQTFEGQLAGLADDISKFMEGDRLLKGQKLRLDRVSSSGMPDANFDQSIEQAMRANLKPLLDDNAVLLLKIEVSYLVSETNTNRDDRVIQIVAKILERGRAKNAPFIREVNNTSDIGRILGNSQAPPDTQDHKVRLTAVEKAFEAPTFKILNKSQVVSPTNADYSVEIRKRVQGKGEPQPVIPNNERGLAFAPVDIGDTYEIALLNYDPSADAVAKIDIDGLDALSTFCADVDQEGKPVKHQGYFVPRATASGPGVHVVTGWLHTIKPGNDNVFEFVVNELGKGAASSLKVRGKTGVITVRFFDAVRPDEKPRARNFGETGKGQPRKQDYTLVPAVVGTEPRSIITIRYSRNPEQ